MIVFKPDLLFSELLIGHLLGGLSTVTCRLVILHLHLEQATLTLFLPLEKTLRTLAKIFLAANLHFVQYRRVFC